MTYAYDRVSSRDQNLDRQLSAFRSLGIPSKHKKNRPEAVTSFCKTSPALWMTAEYRR